MVKNMNTSLHLQHLSIQENQALQELCAFIKEHWPQARLKVFGSKFKGTADDESDLRYRLFHHLNGLSAESRVDESRASMSRGWKSGVGGLEGSDQGTGFHQASCLCVCRPNVVVKLDTGNFGA